jgi:hypothetical protein
MANNQAYFDKANLIKITHIITEVWQTLYEALRIYRIQLSPLPEMLQI